MGRNSIVSKGEEVDRDDEGAMEEEEEEEEQAIILYDVVSYREWEQEPEVVKKSIDALQGKSRAGWLPLAPPPSLLPPKVEALQVPKMLVKTRGLSCFNIRVLPFLGSLRCRVMGNTLLSYTRLPLRFLVIVFQTWEKIILIATQGVEFSGTIQYTDWTKTRGKRSGPTVEKVSLDKRQKWIIKIVVLLALVAVTLSSHRLQWTEDSSLLAVALSSGAIEVGQK